MATIHSEPLPRQISPSDRPLTWGDISPSLRQRLRLEGITTPGDWLAAGKRRLSIFGIPRGLRQTLDALARKARQS